MVDAALRMWAKSHVYFSISPQPYRNVQSGPAEEVTSTLRQVVVIGDGHREAIITWLHMVQLEG